MDILLLAEKYIELYASRQNKSIAGMTNATAQKLLAYRWPGNVRELRNAMEHAVTLTNHRKIIPDDLPEKILTFRSDHAVKMAGMPASGELVPMAEMMHRYMHHVLTMVGGNRTLPPRFFRLIARPCIVNCTARMMRRRLPWPFFSAPSAHSPCLPGQNAPMGRSAPENHLAVHIALCPNKFSYNNNLLYRKFSSTSCLHSLWRHTKPQATERFSAVCSPSSLFASPRIHVFFLSEIRSVRPPLWPINPSSG
jgi:hypothetical protein